MFTSGRNGRGLAYVYTGAGGACPPRGRSGGRGAKPGGRRAGRRSGLRSDHRGRDRGQPGRRGPLACRFRCRSHRPASRNGGQIPKSNFGFRFLPEILPRPSFWPLGKRPRQFWLTDFTRTILPETKSAKAFWPFDFTRMILIRKRFGLVSKAALWPNQQRHT